MQKVKFSQFESEWIQLSRGVPQGTVLGPLLFNIYVNDINKTINNDCDVVQYADDTFLFCIGHDLEITKSKLENNIDRLIEFFESHELK